MTDGAGAVPPMTVLNPAIDPPTPNSIGSNLNAEVLTERRRITPLAARPALARGYRLGFTLPGGPLEPGNTGIIADVSDDADDEEPYQVSGKNGQTWWYEVRHIEKV